jgi:hypothetical protein
MGMELVPHKDPAAVPIFPARSGGIDAGNRCLQ